MARLATSGCETIGGTGTGGPSGSSRLFELVNLVGLMGPTTAVKRSGQGAWTMTDSAAGHVAVTWTKAFNTWFYTRAWFRVTGIPPSTSRRVTSVLDGVTGVYDVYLGSDGRLSRNVASGPYSLPILANEWHCLQIALWGDGTTSKRAIFSLDGQTFDDVTTLSAVLTIGNELRCGYTVGGADGNTIYVDDIAVNDDTGTAPHNTYPSLTGRIVATPPVADSAIGSGWTLGAGGAVSANAYQSVDNQPPVGVVNVSATNAGQIRDASSTLTSPAADADFQMAAYDTLVPADQTITLLQAYAAIGISSTTVAQDVEFGLVSNPSESRPTTNLPTGTAASSYPGGWRRVVGALLTNPSAVRGTRPVVKVKKLTATTTALMCCYVGLQMEYEAVSSGFRRFLAVA